MTDGQANKAAALWGKLGVRLTAEHIQREWERISRWANSSPLSSRDRESMVAKIESNQQTAVNILSKDTDKPAINYQENRTKENSKMILSSIYKGKYLKVADLKGQRVRVTIDKVVVETIGGDEKLVAYFEERKVQPLVLNRTNASMLAEIAGSDETDDWAGIAVILYQTRVDFQGKRVDAIRIESPKPPKLGREPGEDNGDDDLA
jgi:hypothetical protein